jgi:DNA-binding CsgD family transcriptional regulator
MKSGLSLREWEVLRLTASGEEYREIATELDIHPETVKSHRRNVIRKLGARNMCNAVYIGYCKGILK